MSVIIGLVRTGRIIVSAALLVVIGTAWLMDLVGVSMALGAFLGGVVGGLVQGRYGLQAVFLFAALALLAWLAMALILLFFTRETRCRQIA